MWTENEFLERCVSGVSIILERDDYGQQVTIITSYLLTYLEAERNVYVKM